MTECERCGLPIENMLHFVVSDGEVLCETCFEQISQFREDGDLKRLVTITIEDDFGRTVTKLKTRLSPPMLMDKILELEEVE